MGIIAYLSEKIKPAANNNAPFFRNGERRTKKRKKLKKRVLSVCFFFKYVIS